MISAKRLLGTFFAAASVGISSLAFAQPQEPTHLSAEEQRALQDARKDIVQARSLYDGLDKSTIWSEQQKLKILFQVRYLVLRYEREHMPPDSTGRDGFRLIGSDRNAFQERIREGGIKAVAEIIAKARENPALFDTNDSDVAYGNIDSVFVSIGYDPHDERTWRNYPQVKADWKSLVYDLHVNKAKNLFAYATTPEAKKEMNAPQAYHLLTEHIPHLLASAGFDLRATSGRIEAYKSIAEGLTEDAYNNHVKDVAVFAAQDKLRFVYQARDNNSFDMTLFQEIDKALREAGFKPEAGEGYEHLGITFDQFKVLRHQQAVQGAKFWLAKAQKDENALTGQNDAHLRRILHTLRIGALDLDKEETYQEIGTTKAEFESLKKKSGYSEPPVPVSVIYAPKLAFSA